MGQNKALLPIFGEPLLAHIARAVAAVTATVTLVGDPQLYAALGFPVIPDIYPGCGPLAGIHAALHDALHDAEDPWSLVAACDMPVPEHVWAGLVQQPRDGFDAVLPIDAAGRPEPLGALYHRNCLPAIEAALAAGRYKVTDALAGLRIRQVPFPDAVFGNLNTPEEWRQFVSQHV